MAAEIPLLTKQRLNSYSEVGGESVYYLNWVGSKGYPDNKTHLLAVLARHANKAINFFIMHASLQGFYAAFMKSQVVV